MRRVFAYHPVYGYKFIPHLKARVPTEAGGYLVRTNGMGFRSNREYEAARRAGVSRILIFGDSFTAADGVRNEDRYSDVLEGMLPGVEVLNFAVSGTGTDQQYLIFREEAADFNYDLIVLAVLVENIRRIGAHFRPFQDEGGDVVLYAKPYFTLGSDGALALNGTPVSPEPLPAKQLPEAERAFVDQGGRFAALRKLATKVGAREVLQKMTHYQPVPEYDDPEHLGWRLMKAILERWIAEIRSPVVLFPLPLYQHVEETATADGYRARFQEVAHAPRVVVHDPLSYFLRRDRGVRRSFRFPNDIHPTPAAHCVLAEALADAVRPLLPATGGAAA